MANTVHINSFADETVAKLARAVRRLEVQYRNLASQRPRLADNSGGFPIRGGVTSTSPKFPNYPTSGCKFVVQFSDWSFSESAINECDELDVKPWAKRFVVARTLDGSFVAQHTKVLIVALGGTKGRRWWIVPTNEAPATAGGYAARITEEIQAASGTSTRTFGSGKVDLYKNNGGDSELVEDDVTVLNTSILVGAVDMWVQVKRDPFGTYWWDVADCGEE